MSRPRFLADNDLKDAIVEGVLRRDPTAEFARARELGLDRIADEDVLDRAADLGLIVVSHDLNTMSAAAWRRVAAGRPMSGLFLTPQTAAIGEVIGDLLLVLSSSEAEEWAGRVEFLPFPA